MSKRLSGDNTKTAPNLKETLVSTFLVANAFVWFLCGFRYLQEATTARFGDDSLILVVGINVVSLLLSALAAIALTSRIKQRLQFLKWWTLCGVLLSVIFAVVNLTNFTGFLVLASIIGVYFGVGMPTCMGYFAKTTQPQNRAKSSGIIILLIGICLPLISAVGSEAIVFVGALLIWRVIPLIFLQFLKPTEKPVEIKERISYRAIISNKSFLLYVGPWFMFSLINDLTMKINYNYFTGATFPPLFGQNYMLVENVLAGASAIICGFLADKKGRKRLALIGFALLGVGYASLGLFSISYYAAWFYICVDGIAWGTFSMLFLFTIWGDIADGKSSEKYYLLGVLPYLLSNLARSMAGSFISESVVEGTVFSFASFFLFIAILPLAYAPETLSDKIIKNLDLNSYINKAMEKANKQNANSKVTRSVARSNKLKLSSASNKAPDVSTEYEEAKKLAEKYY